ncbi:MAG: hypothetical protein QOE07_1208 [Acidimicrobiaceae bacterium]|jgi:hypothetical protein|nr:hypothetical protein [Acidimicrobiaceae bacterium]
MGPDLDPWQLVEPWIATHELTSSSLAAWSIAITQAE